MCKTTIWPLNNVQGVEGIDFVVGGFVATKNAATNFPNGHNLLVAVRRKILKLSVIHVGKSSILEKGWENVSFIPGDLISLYEGLVITDWKGVGRFGLLNGLSHRAEVIESSLEVGILVFNGIESSLEEFILGYEIGIHHLDVPNLGREFAEGSS